MIVENDDLKNYQDKVPVRKGCGSNGYYSACACTGSCHKIVGWIDKQKYLDFINQYKTIEEFITENYDKVEEQPFEEREYKISVVWITNKTEAFKILKRLNVPNSAKIVADPKGNPFFIKGTEQLKVFLEGNNNVFDIISFTVHKKLNDNWIDLEEDDNNYLYVNN